ncbi:hypothetical protein ACLB2K_054778 [Fragaria x ananassa]
MDTGDGERQVPPDGGHTVIHNITNNLTKIIREKSIKLPKGQAPTGRSGERSYQRYIPTEPKWGQLVSERGFYLDLDQVGDKRKTIDNWVASLRLTQALVLSKFAYEDAHAYYESTLTGIVHKWYQSFKRSSQWTDWASKLAQSNNPLDFAVPIYAQFCGDITGHSEQSKERAEANIHKLSICNMRYFEEYTNEFQNYFCTIGDIENDDLIRTYYRKLPEPWNDAVTQSLEENPFQRKFSGTKYSKKFASKKKYQFKKKPEYKKEQSSQTSPRKRFFKRKKKVNSSSGEVKKCRRWLSKAEGHYANECPKKDKRSSKVLIAEYDDAIEYANLKGFEVAYSDEENESIYSLEYPSDSETESASEGSEEDEEEIGYRPIFVLQIQNWKEEDSDIINIFHPNPGKFSYDYCKCDDNNTIPMYCERKKIGKRRKVRLIRPSNSPRHAPAFLVRNHAEQLRGKARMVIDYRDVNKKTIKNGYQIAQVCKLIVQKGIILGQKKIHLIKGEIDFLGIHVKDGKIRLQDHIVKKISQFSDNIPYAKSLQRFLGVVNFARDFIPQVARIICLTLLQEKEMAMFEREGRNPRSQKPESKEKKLWERFKSGDKTVGPLHDGPCYQYIVSYGTAKSSQASRIMPKPVSEEDGRSSHSGGTNEDKLVNEFLLCPKGSALTDQSQVKRLASPSQTADGKGISSPLMAVALPKSRRDPFRANKLPIVTGKKVIHDQPLKIFQKPVFRTERLLAFKQKIIIDNIMHAFYEENEAHLLQTLKALTEELYGFHTNDKGVHAENQAGNSKVVYLENPESAKIPMLALKESEWYNFHNLLDLKGFPEIISEVVKNIRPDGCILRLKFVYTPPEWTVVDGQMNYISPYHHVRLIQSPVQKPVIASGNGRPNQSIPWMKAMTKAIIKDVVLRDYDSSLLASGEKIMVTCYIYPPPENCDFFTALMRKEVDCTLATTTWLEKVETDKKYKISYPYDLDLDNEEEDTACDWEYSGLNSSVGYSEDLETYHNIVNMLEK